MLITAAASALFVLQAATVAQPPVTTDNTATRTVASATVARVADSVSPANHLDSARRALANGQFDVARREFVIAAALERDAGRVPVEASFGLAHVLYSQSYNREAAIVLGQLAEEAAKQGDIDTEVRARLDAIWLNLDAGQRAQARADASRLRSLIDDTRLTAETRKLLKARLG
jgi:hypothetical protein